MQLEQAVMYRLFAPTGSPRRSLWLRAAAFAAAIVLLGWLAVRIAPVHGALYGRTSEAALLWAVMCFFVHAFYVLSDSAHRAFMERLRLLHYLPVKPVKLRKLQLMVYAPVTIAGSIIVVALYVSFAASLGGLLTLAVAGTSFVLVAGSQILLRTAQGRLGDYAQWVGAGCMATAVLLAWQLAGVNGGAVLWQAVALLMAFLHLTLVGWAATCPPRTTFAVRVSGGTEQQNIGITGGLAIRAFRTGRYRGANMLLCLVLAGLSVGVAAKKQAIPFDAAAIICLLLAGTIAQEVRTLSPPRYPLELFLYGQLGGWLRAMWILTFGNAVFFIELILITAIVVFPYNISVSYAQLGYMGVCLVAVAAMAGALVVPNKNDILVQLASTVLYGGLAYGVFRLLGSRSGNAQAVLTILIVAVSLGVSCAAEKLRWLVTIRGKHAIVYR